MLPVNSRTVWPGPTVPSNGWPAGAAPITRSVASSVAVGGAQRVAVHGGDVGWGLGQAGDDGVGGDAVPGVGQGDDLGRRGAQVGEDAGAGFLDADHAASLQVGNRRIMASGSWPADHGQWIMVCLASRAGRQGYCPAGLSIAANPGCQ